MRFALLSLLIAFSHVAFAADRNSLKAGVFEPPHMAPEFKLRGSHGRDVSLDQFRGRLVLLAFGFTSCPEVCPTTLATLAQARKQFGDGVQVLFITVDPERDTPQQMRHYLNGFDADIIGATGTPDQLAAVRKAYGVTAEKKPVGDTYMVAHSSSTWLIDRAGRLRAMMPYGRRPADYLHDLKILQQ